MQKGAIIYHYLLLLPISLRFVGLNNQFSCPPAEQLTTVFAPQPCSQPMQPAVHRFERFIKGGKETAAAMHVDTCISVVLAPSPLFSCLLRALYQSMGEVKPELAGCMVRSVRPSVR
jgi:hypothetical protein